jgi:hypothetical protein
MTEEDRYCLVTLNRWSQDPIFTQGDVSVILLTENLSDLSPRLVRAPSNGEGQYPPAGRKGEGALSRIPRQEGFLLLEPRLSTERMAVITSGLNLMNLNQIAAESFEEDKPITSSIYPRKKGKSSKTRPWGSSNS